MEKLIIENFLNIKHIEIEIADINIIIGPQAQGKSILAKLVFFFKDFWYNYRISILRQQNKREFDRSIIQEFQEIFSQYSWKDNCFKLEYHLDKYEIILENKIVSKSTKLNLSYSEDLSRARNNIIKNTKQSTKNGQLSLLSFIFEDSEEIDLLLSFSDSNLDFIRLDNLEKPIFIPAGRSFFANLQKNIFSFLVGNISIDYFLKEFGSLYESIKSTYSDTYSSSLHTDQEKQQEIKNKQDIRNLVNLILSGEYRSEKGEDWIYHGTDRRRVNLSNASSGQQEALPMLVILSTLPFTTFAKITKHLFLIEEPEAHLFPSSQKSIIELISLIFNITQRKNRFFITTHSPYILTALNNHIQAKNTYNALASYPDKQKEVFKIIPENQMIDIAYVKAYTLEQGELKSIINDDTQLINAEAIDITSVELGEQFEQLLELQYSND